MCDEGPSVGSTTCLTLSTGTLRVLEVGYSGGLKASYAVIGMAILIAVPLDGGVVLIFRR
jgi:hypothetical protein